MRSHARLSMVGCGWQQGTLAWVSPLVKDPDATKAVLAMDTASPALQRSAAHAMERGPAGPCAPSTRSLPFRA